MGHSVTYSWFKDALKFKRGIVKVWWDTRDEETREEYRGLSQVELAQIMDDPEIEVIEQRSYPDEEDAKQRQHALEAMQQQIDRAMNHPQGGQIIEQSQMQMQAIQQAPAMLLYDIAAKRKKKGGKLCVENVPPEEFGVSRKAKTNLQESPSVVHRFKRTKSELLSMGYSKGLIESLGSDNTTQDSSEKSSRLSFDQDYVDYDEALPGDDSQKEFWVSEVYMRVDFDKDGISELRKITRAGGRILDNEIVDIIPFVAICPIPEPHKFYGLSVADLAMEGQKAETGILRGVIDNQNLEVNGRYYAVDGQVNLDDLLSSRPGGVVRVKSREAVGRLDQGKGNLGESMSLLEYMQSYSEDSTGWSRLSQGNDPSSLNKPETATKANIVTNKADMRVDLIARNFAEGFVDLFRMMLKLVCQYQNKAVSIKLSGKWTDMDPREWRNQFDVTINVGLGVGSKDQQIQHLMALQNAQAQGMMIGIAKPENMYESSVELAKAMGFKSPQKFFTEPEEGAKLPNPGEAEAQAKMQMHQTEQQAKMQMQQMELQQTAQLEDLKRQHEAQLEQARMQMQAEVDNNRQAAEAQQHALKVQQDAQLEQMRAHYEDVRHQREMEFQMWKVQKELEGKLDVAQISAQATLSAAQESASDKAQQ
jgi:hypothetical protein